MMKLNKTLTVHMANKYLKIVKRQLERGQVNKESSQRAAAAYEFWRLEVEKKILEQPRGNAEAIIKVLDENGDNKSS